MKNYKVMKAHIGRPVDLKRKDWIFEPKLDGYRALLYWNGKKVKLISRGGIDLTDKYPFLSIPCIKSNLKKIKSCVLDGEIRLSQLQEKMQV